ncbi:MAG: hypothetical protein ACREVG_01645 [Burkholderiales bacterium]
MSDYDYSYEPTDEQLLYYSSLPAIAKLQWLDEARHFTILMRGARRTYYRNGKPVETIVRSVDRLPG